MSDGYAALKAEAATKKSSFNSQAKRIIKTKPPTGIDSLEDIKNNLISTYNDLSRLLVTAWNTRSENEKDELENTFIHLRDRAVIAFNRLSYVAHTEHAKDPEGANADRFLALATKFLIPDTIGKRIDPQEVDELSWSDEETEKENSDGEELETIMTAQEKQALRSLVKEMITVDYDGSPAHLRSFIDKLEVIKDEVGTLQSYAATLIKTRLTGDARDLVVSEDSIEAIIQTLKKIKAESSAAIESKMEGLRQQGCNPTIYADKVDELTKLLRRAYISEGDTVDRATDKSVARMQKCLVRNADDRDVRNIVQAGNFRSTDELKAKFIDSSNEARIAKNAAAVLKFQRQPNRYGNFNQRGRGSRNGYHSRSSNTHNGRDRGGRGRGRGQGAGRSNYDDRSRGGNYDSGYRGHDGGYRNRGNRVNVLEAQNSGNEGRPQENHLGDQDQY